jgi:hypothetical protein
MDAQSTVPLSLATDRSVAVTSSRVSFWRSAFRSQPHHIGLIRARDDETQPSELGMALGDFRDLLGPHEHALDLGGLVGAAHPALDAHVAVSAGAAARQHGREIPECEANPGVMEVKRGDDDLADAALGHGIAGGGRRADVTRDFCARTTLILLRSTGNCQFAERQR